MTQERRLECLSDDELLFKLGDLLRQSRRVESTLVAHMGEVDERRLYARYASPSMFSFCTEVLHLSEAEAYLRIEVARASRKHPVLLEMLGDGRLHLSGIAKLAPHLTEYNRESLLARAAGKSKRQIEELVAELAPRPDVPPVIRKLPEPRKPASPAPVLELRPDGVASFLPSPPLTQAVDVATAPAVPYVPPTRPAKVEPLAPARYRVEFTASAELYDKLKRLQSLMRSSVVDGDLAAILEVAVTEKLERLEAKRYAKTGAPRKRLEQTDTAPLSRHIPAPVRRFVYERDGGQCTFVDAHAKRCPERDRLEFHHHNPFGRGGDHSVENISLRCRQHNVYQAERDYGRDVMGRYGRSPGMVREPTSRTVPSSIPSSGRRL